MMEMLKKYRILVVLATFSLLEVVALLSAPGWYSNTKLLNTLLFIGISYLAVSPFWGEHHSPIWGLLWSVSVMGPLGKFFGIIEVALYWYLFSKKKKTPSRPDAPTRTVPDTVFARIPILRIPIPWIRYHLTDKYITRITWFGKDDPEPFSRIENWYISGTATRLLTGTSTFGFRSKKPHADDYVVWRFLPAKFAEEVSARCVP